MRERGIVMTVRKFGDRWQCDFYAYSQRIRKVFPAKKDAAAYEGKIKASIRENRYFDIDQPPIIVPHSKLDLLNRSPV